ncbi:hypothetical protein Lal_00022145 [Lupinus albus]|nr:hypothetical protein Lal_00022145 [Lupinus albus]
MILIRLVHVEEELQNLTLLEIEKILQVNRKCLRDYPSMSYPNIYHKSIRQHTIYDKLGYDIVDLNHNFNLPFNSLTCTTIYSHFYKHIVLIVASNDIISLLLPGGRKARSKFKIHVPTLITLFRSELAKLLKQTKLIIWDDTNIALRHLIRVLQGMIQLFLEFLEGTTNIASDSKSMSFRYYTCNNQCIIYLALLYNINSPKKHTVDGKLSEPIDGYVEIDIPKEFLILNFDNPIDIIIQSTYSNLQDLYKSEEFLQSKAILASTIEIVDQINEFFLSLISSDKKEYLNSNFIDTLESNESEVFNILILEFLVFRTIKSS